MPNLKLYYADGYLNEDIAYIEYGIFEDEYGIYWFEEYTFRGNNND